jgi:hypothetical protein
MGNWIPNDPTLSPLTWGNEAAVHERFCAAGIAKENIASARETYFFNLPPTIAGCSISPGISTGQR